MVPFALLAYGIVFIVSHAINILILISPFATVDAALKAFRLFLLTSIAGSSMLSPKLGAVWAVFIILCCIPFAGWAFRLAVYGHVLSWDLLTFARRRARVSPEGTRAFLSRKVSGVPRRTLGTVFRDDSGQLMFRYRPFLILPARTLPLPEARHAIGRGFLHPELLEVNGDATDDILDFPPRYNTHEDGLATAHRVGDVRDIGLRAAWSWFTGLFATTGTA